MVTEIADIQPLVDFADLPEGPAPDAAGRPALTRPGRRMMSRGPQLALRGGRDTDRKETGKEDIRHDDIQQAGKGVRGQVRP
jgi:hypothetical protein